MTYELPNYIVFERGAIGETVNTTGCEPVMNGFDSRIAPQTKRNSSDNGGFFLRFLTMKTPSIVVKKLLEICINILIDDDIHTSIIKLKKKRITIAEGARLENHDRTALSVFAEENTCGRNFVKDGKFFVPHQVGTAVIKAKNGDLASDNFISVVAQESDAGIGKNCKRSWTLKAGLFWQEYNIGIPAFGGSMSF